MSIPREIRAKTKIRRWDAADYLKRDADVIAYLEAALEDGESGVVAAALGDIARAKGMTKVADRHHEVPSPRSSLPPKSQ